MDVAYNPAVTVACINNTRVIKPISPITLRLCSSQVEKDKDLHIKIFQPVIQTASFSLKIKAWVGLIATRRLCLAPPRVCEDYWSEFRHCKSLWNRFHYYYTYGGAPSCQQWREDYKNCKQWERHKDAKAKEELQMSERGRVAEQQRFTPVWELREEPPKDWHMPLNQEKSQDI